MLKQVMDEIRVNVSTDVLNMIGMTTFQDLKRIQREIGERIHYEALWAVRSYMIAKIESEIFRDEL
jgi:flagellar biosynthesis regulator FlbT